MRTFVAALGIASLLALAAASGASAATLKQQNDEAGGDARMSQTNEDQPNDEDAPKTTPKSETTNKLSASEGDNGRGPETKGRDNVLKQRTRR